MKNCSTQQHLVTNRNCSRNASTVGKTSTNQPTCLFTDMGSTNATKQQYNATYYCTTIFDKKYRWQRILLKLKKLNYWDRIQLSYWSCKADYN